MKRCLVLFTFDFHWGDVRGSFKLIKTFERKGNIRFRLIYSDRQRLL